MGCFEIQMYLHILLSLSLFLASSHFSLYALSLALSRSHLRSSLSSLSLTVEGVEGLKLPVAFVARAQAKVASHLCLAKSWNPT